MRPNEEGKPETAEQPEDETGADETPEPADTWDELTSEEVNEPLPFFPYEVQFTYGGMTRPKWFENPEDTVEIGGHEFRVACGGESAYPGFQVGEYYVPASLLQLEEAKVNVDFSGFLPEKLEEVQVRTFLESQTLNSGDTVLWINTNDSFERYTPNGTVNLSQYAYGRSSKDSVHTAQIIDGSFDQLDLDNTCYIVRFTTSNLGDLMEMQAYTSARTKIDSEYYVSSSSVRQDDGKWETYYYSMSGYS